MDLLKRLEIDSLTKKFENASVESQKCFLLHYALVAWLIIIRRKLFNDSRHDKNKRSAIKNKIRSLRRRINWTRQLIGCEYWMFRCYFWLRFECKLLGVIKMLGNK